MLRPFVALVLFATFAAQAQPTPTQTHLDPQAAQQPAHPDPQLAEALAQVTWYPAVPLAVQRVAGIERAQMLLESPSRAALQRVLAACAPLLHQLRTAPAHRGIVRWAIDVDPLAL